MNNHQLKYIIAILSLSLFLPLSSLAAGIQVSPSHLDFRVNSQETAPQNLTVVNPTADVQVFEVYADDFAELIKPNPASFTLESGAKKTVAITINFSGVKDQSERTLTTNLSVVGKPLADSRFSLATGAKIPITLSVGNMPQVPNSMRLIIGLTSLLVLMAILALFYRVCCRMRF